jgi:aspartate/methionine/tyrosine aminotransferase
VIVDDAYFGLVYEDGILKESIFARLASAHPGILAVKVDGATKEDFVWGYRVGFITFAYAGSSRGGLDALSHKAAGAVRGSISSASHLSQSLILSAYNAVDYPVWKAKNFEVLRTRYNTVRTVLRDHPEYADSFTPHPFNSGYFLCVRPIGAVAELIRKTLIEDFDTGVIAVGDLVRIAYSSVPCALLPQLFENLHRVIQAQHA